MSEKFKDKCIVITGGANGIGENIAFAFADQGAIVWIADLDEEKSLSVKNQIEASGGRVYFHRTNVSNEKDIIDLFQDVKAKCGKLDVLINNAGIAVFKPLLELSTLEWEKVIQTNLSSVFIASREASKIMPEGGRIINMASTRALMSEPNSEAYAASKGGILSLTHALAASLQSKGIAVNSISPGWIQTNNYDGLSENDHKQHWSNRVGHPIDISMACLYLADPENNFMNGQNIIVDGGMTRKMIYEE